MATFTKTLVFLFVLTLTTVCEAKDASEFPDYLKALQQEATQKGFDPKLVAAAIESITFRPTVVKADKNQPERKITLDDYLQSRVPDWKVKQAVNLAQEHAELLDDIAAQYGVQKRYIVALWGNESNFGRIQGNFSVLSALSSLAFEGRREALFKKQFFAALTILAQGHISIESFKGSWAGAMGQSQFMPTSFLTYAVDYDGDGKKDIWSTPGDVFASIANFLSSEGWNGSQIWGRQVTIEPEASNLPSGLSKKNYRPLAFWQSAGVRRYDGSDLPDVDMQASLIMPDGANGRIYLVYNNFHTLMRWNRSAYFGVSVGYLSDRIKRGY